MSLINDVTNKIFNFFLIKYFLQSYLLNVKLSIFKTKRTHKQMEFFLVKKDRFIGQAFHSKSWCLIKE
jgi:hypothetical protein